MFMMSLRCRQRHPTSNMQDATTKKRRAKPSDIAKSSVLYRIFYLFTRC
jgi:hypothetical protein